MAKGKKRVLTNIMFPADLLERARPYANDECETPDRWIALVMEDHLNLLDETCKHHVKGERKNAVHGPYKRKKTG